MNTTLSRLQSRIRRPAAGRGRRVFSAAALVFAALLAASLGAARPAYAATINVTTSADEFNTGAGCSLREAIQSANTDTAFGGCIAGSGADTITVPAGTYLITINPGPDENANATGDLDVLSDINFQGAGAASTIIDAQSADRVFDVNPFGGSTMTTSFTGLTIQNGKGFASNFNVGAGIFIGPNSTITVSSSTLSGNQAVNSEGGAIENRGSLTLNSVTFQNNTAKSLGGAVYSIGPLTVNSSTFSGNKAESGGALYITTPSGNSVSITSSTFTGNQAVATSGGADDNGGAIAINTDGGVTVTGSTFTGNSAATNGGAVSFTDSATEAAAGTLTFSLNRITGNSAVAGSGLYASSGGAVAQKNWWGCNAGPTVAPCDRASGGASFTPWIVLSHAASPSTIDTGGTSTLTADFLKNSDGSGNTAGNLGALIGVPITFGSATNGTISNAQTTIQNSGAATATFTAGGTGGAGTAGATVDSQTTTANITISAPADTTPPDTTITAFPPNPSTSSNAGFSFSGSDDTTPVASLTYECQVDGGIFSACTSTQNYTGLADGSHTFQVRAKDSAGNVDPTPASYTWTIDTTAPAVTINQASGQADPTSASPVHFSAVFNEPVSGFGNTGVALSGTALPTTAVVTEIAPNDGTTYDVAVSGMSANGTVTAAIAANVAQDGVGNANTASTSTDNTVTFALGTSPAVTTQPADTVVNSGQTASFTAAASGNPAPTVQWQVSGDNGASWTNVPSATAATFSFTAQATDNGKQFRAVFTNVVSSDTTSAAKLSVDPLALTKSANPTVYSYEGQVIVYSYSAQNTGYSTLTGPFTVADDKLGTFQCGTATSLAPNATVSCTASTTIVAANLNASNDASITNHATLSGTFGAATINSNSAATTVNQVAPTASAYGVSTSCSQFLAGTAATVTTASYGVNAGKVKSVSPTTFIYYSKITAPAASFQAKVQQSNSGGWPNLGLTTPMWTVYDSNCKAAKATGSVNAATVTFNVSGATTGATYVVAIKYFPQGLTGKKVTAPYPTVPYLFTTSVNGTVLAPSWAGVSLMPK